jgi:hypothetical protein
LSERRAKKADAFGSRKPETRMALRLTKHFA